MKAGLESIKKDAGDSRYQIQTPHKERGGDFIKESPSIFIVSGKKQGMKWNTVYRISKMKLYIDRIHNMLYIISIICYIFKGESMKLENVADEYAIYGTLFSLSNRIQTIGDKTFKDITLKQQFMMIALGMFPEPPTLKEMGELIGCSYQNIKRMAEHLQKENYLWIRQDEKDKRKLLLVSTGKMEKMAEKNRKETIAFMENLYRDIPKEDLRTTLRTLMKMDQNIGGVIE